MGAQKYVDPLDVACHTNDMSELIGQFTANRVHVVRHNFEPNKPLSELIESFVAAYAGPPFLLRSTKGVYVDSVTFARGSYRQEDDAARLAVERAKRYPFVVGRAAMRPLYAQSAAGTDKVDLKAYRIGLLPTNQDAFNRLADTLDIYPRVLPAAAPEKHYLFLDVPADAARRVDVDEAEEEFKQTLVDNIQKGLFAATIAGIRSQEVPLRYAKRVIIDRSTDI